jgi:hypothetical protein
VDNPGANFHDLDESRLYFAKMNNRGDTMALDPKYITTLADATKFYYDDSELMELCDAFDVDFSYPFGDVAHVALARSFIQNVEHGNNRRFLRALVASLLSRATGGVARTNYEKRQHHQSMVDLLAPLEAELQEGGLPSELVVPESKPFTAKSESREFLGKAETEVMIVDNWVGIGTLDCLRDVNQYVRLLTGLHTSSLAEGFERVLRDFQGEGQSIEVRRHPKLHDRYILFNNRCWLAGSSLKDAGKKAFNIIEVIDSKILIQAEVSKKWDESTPL